MSKERLQHQYKKTLPRKQAAVIEEEMQPDLAPLVASLEQSSTPRDSLLVQADSPALRQVGMLRLQRSHGNTHVQRMVGESRTASPSPVVQRYQAGDTGHGGIEKYTLQGLGFAPDEAAQVYLGNWLRDLSQLTDKSWVVPILQVLTLGEFGTLVSPEDLGTYVPSEHMDNPEGSHTIEDPRVQALEYETDPNKQAEFHTALNKLSPAQRAAYEKERAYRAHILEAAKNSGLPAYIERGKFHAKEKLTEAVSKGATPEGRRELGDALHGIEDYFSHSNFVEVAIFTLYRRGNPAVAPLVDRMANTNLGANAALVGGPIQEGQGPASLVGQPGIISGTYDPGKDAASANTWVSRFETIKSEIQNGQLTTAFVKGCLRLGGITVAEIGRRLGRQIGIEVGGGVGAIKGAASGAAREFKRGKRLGGAIGRGLGGGDVGEIVGRGVGGAIGGVAGGVSGALEGHAEGEVAGAEYGETVLVKVGEEVGIMVAGGLLVITDQGAATIMLLFPEFCSTMANVFSASQVLLDAAVERNTKKSVVEAARDKLSGPTHSQLAKDAPDNPLWGVSALLASEAVRGIGAAMQAAWATNASGSQATQPATDNATSPTTQGGATTSPSAPSTPPALTPPTHLEPEPPAEWVKSVTHLVDKYVSHPSSDTWWEPIVLAAAGK